MTHIDKTDPLYYHAVMYLRKRYEQDGVSLKEAVIDMAQKFGELSMFQVFEIEAQAEAKYGVISNETTFH